MFKSILVSTLGFNVVHGVMHLRGEALLAPTPLALSTPSPGVLHGELYVDTYIWETEPDEGAEGECRLHLRGYNAGTEPMIRFPEKGTEYLRIAFYNNLAPDGEEAYLQPHNTPRLANTTNFHTHGLHVSTMAPADDVLIELKGGEMFDYEFPFTAPSNQRAGTFWHHAHHHGSTTAQVMSGVVGLLIIEDNPDVTPQWVLDMPEVPLLVRAFKPTELKSLNTPPGNPDHLMDMSDISGCPQEAGGVMLLIGNQIQPVITITQNVLTRFRVVMAGPGVFQQLRMKIEEVPCSMTVMALDGIYVNTPIQNIEYALITAGGRMDIAVMCTAVGTGKLQNIYTDGDFKATNYMIATINVVAGEASTPPFPTEWFLKSYLESSYTAPLVGDGKVDGDNNVCIFGRDNQGKWAVNGRQFPMDPVTATPEWTYTINKISEITMFASVSFHPYHQHMAPFQIISTSFNSTEMYGFDVNGHWYDTFFVPEGQMVIARQKPAFLGVQIIHCHFLPHEDSGMMAVAEIVDGCAATDPCCNLNQCPQDSTTMACVSEFDPYCLNVMWDAQCVAEAKTVCGLTCP